MYSRWEISLLFYDSIVLPLTREGIETSTVAQIIALVAATPAAAILVTGTQLSGGGRYRCLTLASSVGEVVGASSSLCFPVQNLTLWTPRGGSYDGALSLR